MDLNNNVGLFKDSLIFLIFWMEVLVIYPSSILNWKQLLLTRYSFTLGHGRVHATIMPHVTFSFFFMFLTWSLYLGDLVQSKGAPPLIP